MFRECALTTCVFVLSNVENVFVYSVKPSVDDYKPLHFLRCHFCDKNALKKGHTDDDPTDEVTNVWCCVMEPDPVHQGQFRVVMYMMVI